MGIFLFSNIFVFSKTLRKEQIYFSLAKKRNRFFYELEQKKSIALLLNRNIKSLKESEIEAGLLGMQLFAYSLSQKEEKKLTEKLFLTYYKYPQKLRFRIIETCISLSLLSCEKIAMEALLNDGNSKNFAIAADYFQKNFKLKYSKKFIQKILYKNFPNYSDIPELFLLNNYLKKKYSEKLEKSALLDFFSYIPEKNLWYFYSLQNENRDFPGVLLTRKPDGKFLRDKKGNIYLQAQLARSITNVVPYLKSGNTPRGVFSIQGLHIAKSPLIGTTPAFKLFMPNEVSPSQYFHSEPYSREWSIGDYLKLIPYKYRNNLILQETFYAGKAGRDFIYSHGTGIRSAYYKGKPYYPLTPSRGCLVMEEFWNEKTGYLKKSKQLELLNLIENSDKIKGYFYVLEFKKIPDIETIQLYAEQSED